MGRPSQTIMVEVEDLGKDNGERKFVVRISTSAEAFMLSEMLVQEHVIKDLETHLKTANRKAVSDFISSGKNFLRELSKVRREKKRQE